MQLHQLKPIYKRKQKKRVGRGGKHGTYSGRGLKGQKARAGRNLEPVIRGLIKRYPKLRGYKFKAKAKRQKERAVILNLGMLEEKFNPGEKVNPQSLLEKKLISKIERRMPKIKILGKGELTKVLIVENCDVSKATREKIEKTGGKIKIKNQK